MLKFITLLILLITFSLGNFSIAQQKEIQSYTEKAVKANENGDYKNGEIYSLKALNLLKKTNNQSQIAQVYNMLGFSLEMQGDYPNAIKNYFLALGIQSKLKLIEDQGRTFNNLGLAYWGQKNYTQALNYFQKALRNHQEFKDTVGISNVYNNMGIIYNETKRYDLSISYYKKSIEIDSLLKNHSQMADSYSNIGLVYFNLKNYKDAEMCYQKAEQLKKNDPDVYGLINIVTNFSHLYLKTNELQKAKPYIEHTLELASKYGTLEQKKSAYGNFSVYYKEIGDYKNALTFYELKNFLNDSLRNLESLKSQVDAELNYKYEQKKAELKHQSAKKELLNQQAKQKLYILIVSLSIIIFFTIYLFYITNKRRKSEIAKKEIIRKKNQEILDSIQYAKRIQNAILPKEYNFSQHFKEAFVFYQPKDIVAGDFYWLDKINQQILFAVADCTGHGVPGALVSIVCHNALNRAVREFKITKPGEILNKTRELIIEEFKKSDENVKDGMDISLCLIDQINHTLTWAGANSPLWLKKSNNSEIIEYKANKQPIGYFEDLKPFQTLEIPFDTNDTIYLFTDGYVDQFGGENNKKLKSKGLKELILQTSGMNLEEQKEHFKHSFDRWKQENDQIDDVCLIGIQL